ncbi:glutathione S-transferase N-terminal domain-containing protein [Sphingomonas sp. MMS24-JH45]
MCLGIKGLAWRAVDQPVIMPKPDLLALTGGYRRIPVMQIGADIDRDSVLIVRELERRYPAPTLFPTGAAGMDQAAAQWTDRGMFQAAVTVIFAGLGDTVDAGFIKDREAMSGQPFDPAAMRAARRTWRCNCVRMPRSSPINRRTVVHICRATGRG